MSSKTTKVFVQTFQQADEITGEVFDAHLQSYNHESCAKCGTNDVNVICIGINNLKDGGNKWVRVCFDCINEMEPDLYSVNDPRNIKKQTKEDFEL